MTDKPDDSTDGASNDRVEGNDESADGDAVGDAGDPDAGLDHPSEPVEDPSVQHGPTAADDGKGDDEDGMSASRKYVYWITMGMALFVGFVFALLFYTNVQAVINEWIARRYRLLFSTAFNLVVVLAAGIVVSLILRRLESDGD